MPENAANRLDELAREVRYLRPDRHDPEAFHVRKQAIERELRDLAHEAKATRSQPRPQPSAPGARVTGGR